jgi:putative ABC transport system substrate-binding protein
LIIEYRWAEDDYARLPALAADLVRRKVAVIAANTPASLPAKVATKPIVFLTGADPVEVGLVANLNRLGGNLMGVSILNVELGPKRLELLHELVPSATTVAVLINPTNRNTEASSKVMEVAARSLGLTIRILHASTEHQLDIAFATLAEVGAGGLVIGGDAFFVSRSEQLAALSVRYAVPAIFEYRMFAAAGGLMSYGGQFAEPYRLIGNYAGRILNGAKPGDLPVQQDTKVELIFNLKTARALGIVVPLPLVGRADEVIE